MSIVSNPVFTTLRRLLRPLGINRAVGSVIAGSRYEARLADAMAAAMRPGLCVWDVGANIGHYTRRFAELVGPSGKIVAFEPSRINRERLITAVADLVNVKVLPFALSDHAGEAVFRQGEDDIGATSRLVTGAAASGAGEDVVQTRVGDVLVAEGEAVPNVIKIDVEGHEAEVLTGLRETLRSPLVSDVFIEVHFGLLEAAGKKNAPKRIEGLLRECGFCLKWLDPSHVHAHRA